MKSNVALIGFMGAGKTEVGRVLAGKIGKRFVDLDSVIAKKAGKSIASIFEEDGEVAFRELEIEVAKEIARDENLVIACGGGIILNRINVDRLKRNSVVVYLEAHPSLLLERTQVSDEVRPLLSTENHLKTMSNLLKFRKPLYRYAADIKIDTSKLDVDAVVQKIINAINKNESFSF